MGVTDQPKRLQPCLTAEKDADFSPHSSCHPPCPCLLCPPEQTQPDQGPGPGSKPEPTTGSSATPTLTTESSDSLEALPPLPWLRMPDSLPTAGEQGEPGELHSL